MKVGLLGSGIVGQVLGTGFLKHGYEVKMGTREPGAEEIRRWLAQTTGASAVLAVQGRIADKVVHLAGPSNFVSDTVIDCTNPLADAPPANGF